MRCTKRIYLNKKGDVQKLGNLVLSFFKEEGFLTQRFNATHSVIIQAKKGGIMRTLLSMDRSITIVLYGDPNNIEVIMGIKEWMDENGAAVLKNAINSPMTFFDETPESIWAYEIEHHLWNHLETNMEIGL
jgi:hypothetical protein